MLIDEEKSAPSSTSSSGGSSYSMNIIFWIIWRVELYNPVNVWEIESSLGYIGTNKNSCCRLAEFKVGSGSFLLLLFSVDIFYWNINVV